MPNETDWTARIAEVRRDGWSEGGPYRGQWHLPPLGQVAIDNRDALIDELAGQRSTWEIGGLPAAEVNALPDRARRYIHDLETNYDPGGTIQDLHATRDQRDGLTALLTEARSDLTETQRKCGLLREHSLTIAAERDVSRRELAAERERIARVEDLLWREGVGGIDWYESLVVARNLSPIGWATLEVLRALESALAVQNEVTP